MQKCSECQKKFDYDKEGLSCGHILVCSPECAKKGSKNRGNKIAIHDKDNKIVETDADGTETKHIYIKM